MSRLLMWLRWLAHTEAALFSASTAAVLLPVLAQVFHWTTDQAAAASAIAVALASAWAAWKARPVRVPVLTGAAVAVVTALGAWHLRVPGTDVAALAGLLAVLLGNLNRVHLTPVTVGRDAARQQTSAAVTRRLPSAHRRVYVVRA